MSKHWSANCSRTATLLLLPMIGACLTACANWSEVAKPEVPATAPLAQAQASQALPLRARPDIPAEIMACLEKSACRDVAGKPNGKCEKADQIIVAFVGSEQEKGICLAKLKKWWGEQQKIEKSEVAAATGHPKGGAPSKAAAKGVDGDTKWP